MTTLSPYSQSLLPTLHGDFAITVYRDGEREHVLLSLGEVEGAEDLLCRVHSECLTGEVFGSLRCDCRAQLNRAFERIAEEGRGAVLYLRQEGRGIGLGNKIRAYDLQDKGADTVSANEDIGFQPDHRDYAPAAAILADLGVTSVQLLTNNPAKVAGLEKHGIRVARVSHWAGEQHHNRSYLAAKRQRMGHLAADDESESETGT